MPPDRGLHRVGRRLGRDDDSQVPLDRWEARRSRDTVVGEIPAGEASDSDLRDVDPLGAQVQGGDRLGMQLSEATHEVAAGPDADGTTGMQVRVVGDGREGRARPARDDRRDQCR